MKLDWVLNPEGRDLREGVICSHISKTAWVCKTSLHFPVIWTGKKKVKLEGLGCLCSFSRSREPGWELSWLCPKQRMKCCILSLLREIVLPFAFSGAMGWHCAFTSAPLSLVLLNHCQLFPLTLLSGYEACLNSIHEHHWPEYPAHSKGRLFHVTDFVWLQLWARDFWGLKD